MVYHKDFRYLLPPNQRLVACADLLTQVGNRDASISRHGRRVYVSTPYGMLSLHTWTLAWMVNVAVREVATGGAR